MWSDENCLKMIAMWENYPCLFDTGDPDYTNRYKAKNAFTDIARAMGNGITENDVKQKMRSLRTSFLQQLCAYNGRCKSGASALDVAEPTWRFWKALNFLRPFIKTKKGQDNLSLASTNSSESSEKPLVPEEETGDIRVLLTSVGASSGETAEATAAPTSPSVYEQTPPPKVPDCARKKRKVDKLDTTKPASRAVELLEQLHTSREKFMEKAMAEPRQATPNELFYQMVARTTENFPDDIRDQMQSDVFIMMHEIRKKLQNTTSLEK